MKIISWNVAGLRACLNKGFDFFFREIDADIICLQEVKALQEEIPFNPLGYKSFVNPAKRKGYSGTMIITRKNPISITYGMGIEEHDTEGRLITIEYNSFFLINVYVPNVKRELERLPYRMKWESDFLNYVSNLKKRKNIIICGDLNVARTEKDIKNAKKNIGKAGFTSEEKQKLELLLSSGFIDTYRYFYPDKLDSYTWWSYLSKSREKNIGWRIDYFLVNNEMIKSVKTVKTHTDILGSDHCPIELEINEEF